MLGAGHPETLVTIADLALMYKNYGQPEGAEPLYLEVLAGRRKLLGEEHPDTLIIMNNLGALYSTQRRFAEAEPLLAQSRGRPEAHPRTRVTSTRSTR